MRHRDFSISNTSKVMTSRVAKLIMAGLCLAGSVAIFSSCEEPVRLDLDQTDPKVIIEGMVTNHPGYQYVKVSRSVDFYAKGKTPRVTNATVLVTDNAGNVHTFVHNPRNHADSAGYYLPQNSFEGVVGRTYHLEVVVDGQTYEAEDRLNPVTKMDSLSYRLDESEAEDPEVEGRIYEVLMYTKEPRNEVNYYFFRFFRNDSLTFNNETEIYFSDDEFLAENIDGVEAPFNFSMGDKAKVEMYSISRTGYVYFSDLFSILNNDAGGMFGSVPAPPRSNLTNGALGFFQVSALDISEMTLE